MQKIAMFIMLGILGFVCSIASGFIEYPMNLMIAAFGGMLCFLAILQMLGIAKQKGFLALYKDLADDEKYIWIPDIYNKIHLTIMKSSHKGILYFKGLGLFEDKGTTFLFGKDRMGFALPESGYTLNLESEQYFSLLKKDEGLTDWDDCVKAYLTPDQFLSFEHKFRKPGKEVTLHMINEELDWLANQIPQNKLEKHIMGKTIDFRSRCLWLKYNYDPSAAENATDAEKIITWKRAIDYRDVGDYKKYASIGKMIVMVLLGVVILVVVLSSIDLSNFGSLFGG